MHTNLATIALKSSLQRALAGIHGRCPAPVVMIATEAERPLFVRADSEKLESAISSLVIMAAQALGGQSGRIEVVVEEMVLDEVVLDQNADKLLGGLPPRGHVCIRIANGAVTVPPDDAPAVGGDRAHEAVRLSLASVRDIIEACHGSLTVSSAFGGGTRFEVYMPLAAAPLATTAGEAGVKHVLYVDDYEAMCDLAWDALTDHGYRVTCFQDALEAVAAVKAHPLGFDIAVLDFNMPKLNGMALTRELLRINPKLPVVIISGYVAQGLEEKALKEGARALVNKAHDLAELCDIVQRLLQAA